MAAITGEIPPFTLKSPSEFLAACPKFRILVLGNPESTKQEIFSKVFGIDLEKKLLADAFNARNHHPVEEELDLHGQNARLTVFTSHNFGTGDETAYRAVSDFLASPALADAPIHCIWYCIASEEGRSIHSLETQFFAELPKIAPRVPVVLVFTKYDEFVTQVQLDWSRDASRRGGVSKVAVAHILRDLSVKRFEKTIGRKWDEASGRTKGRQIPRVCVSGGPEDGDESYERLAARTLASLRDRSVQLSFAAAQRSSAFISTQFCADTAAEYFTVDTGHARKVDGVDMNEIIPNFFAEAYQIFNMRDVSTVLLEKNLLTKILEAAFPGDRLPFLLDALHHSGTDQTMMLNLSPHERAVLLTQALAMIVLFLHKLAEMQWPHQDNFSLSVVPPTLTPRAVERVLNEMHTGKDKTDVLEAIEENHIFSSCRLREEISDLILNSVHGTDKIHIHHEGVGNPTVRVDDDDLNEISLAYVNDKGPDDMFLPCGLKILKLN
ncbi:hypothetical protein B0T22DRAFT_309847 [Podospora appendiculata]|uniref:G domain-containing protein n=1 Tax=Podospora appendiculata TaxID=314037 RepID=A0AAE0WYL9_9PEZI|nr:hypothetical protein B0T22DRAFT_309847 [Podospora appendiculata]